MIRYDLICNMGHEFDGWFSDSASYDTQHKRGFVACTHCGSIKIEKQLMAPHIGSGAKRSPSAAPDAQRMMSPATDPRLQAMLHMMREMRAHVEKTADNVGDKFAEEARKMHYNESEKRGIYGQATADDAKSLLEEGIEVMPLPMLPEDGN